MDHISATIYIHLNENGPDLLHSYLDPLECSESAKNVLQL